MNQPADGAQQRHRILRFAVPTRDVLARLIAAGEPFPQFAEAPVRERARRDVYYDTAAADLEARGAAVRVRHRADGRRTLFVDVWERPNASGHRTRVQADVPREEANPFAGESDAVDRVRSLVDPRRLQPAIELELLRRERVVEVDGVRIEVSYDQLTVRRAETSVDLEELDLRAPADRPDVLEGVLERLEQEYGLQVTLANRVARAREALEDRRVERLTASIRSARDVVLVPVLDGRVALLEGKDGWTFPAGPGKGGAAMRELLREVFGSGQGEARVLDQIAGFGRSPALEVWMVDEVADPSKGGRDGRSVDGPPMVWLTPAEAIEHAGGPRLRETRTLAALNVFLRRAADSISLEDSPIARRAARRRDFVRHGAPEADLKGAQPELPPEQLLNMELSRMSFDERILVMAEDERTPLLERVRFLSMFGSRQDDFFMTRVGGFKDQLVSNREQRTLDGLTPEQQLHLIGIRARRLSTRAYKLWTEQLLPALAEQDIGMLSWDDLGPDERAALRRTYARQVEAVLTPLTADPSHPFPHIRNLRPAIAALLKLPESDSPRFAAIELPGDLPRFVPIRDGRHFVPLREVILAGLPDMYPGMEVVSAHAFRVTRSATARIRGGDVQDVLQAVEEEVTRRPFRHAVRLEVERDMPEEMIQILLRELRREGGDRVVDLGPEDVFPVSWEVDLASVKEVADLEDEELRFDAVHRTDPLRDVENVFDALDEGDRFVLFPDDSFEASVGRFLQEAAEDDQVAAIKITLYRTDPSSPVVEALERASSRGKQVAVLVELKASFDEVRNIAWARRLEGVGARVVFSPPKYKVHAKLALVVRRGDGRPRRYAYIGTGNLNAATAASYVDVGLLTADDALCEEVGDVFNLLTGFTPQRRFEHLLVAPFNMRPRFIEMIEREAAHAQAGRPSGIRVQLNGLSDRRIIASLYRASTAGVPIDMAVREICCLRPGVPGLSDNIRIVSLLGRFLQHARIYHFVNGGDDEYFIGSADWRPRNLLRRVELVAPVRDPRHAGRLSDMLDSILNHPEAWVLNAEGRFVRDQLEAGSALAIDA